MKFELPEQVLERYWGYPEFRPMQAEIIRSVLDGADTLGLLPTGGGKSVTFQVPALMLPGLTLVVTPLISLMKDQVDRLRAMDIPALYLHSGLTRAEQNLALKKAELGKIKLLYLSPEKLQGEQFLSRIREWNVSLIVVDEAHCISQWGYDFRPSYLRIASLRAIFPSAPVMALTASATPEVVDDIMTQLQFRCRTAVFRRSFARPNISYVVRPGDNKPERLLRVLRNTSGPAIVYVRSRKRTREIAEALRQAGVTADYYHAGIAPEEKDQRQQAWMDDRVRVMVATNAFGMGIDKPDVRVVVHYDLPSSLEEYYQEAGRAGRDGKPSFAVVLASARDKATLTRRLTDAFPPKEFIAEVYDRACVFIDLCLGEGYNEVFDFNINHFCDRLKLQAVPVRSALRILTRTGLIEYVEDVDARARVMMLASKQELYALRLTDAEDAVLQYLLRNCAGIFADYVQITEQVIADALGLTQEQVYQALLSLTRSHTLHYVPRRTEPYIFFPSRRIAQRYVAIPRTVYEDMRQRMERRIEAMKRFVFGPDECRANAILTYFGEKPAEECGQCDTCRSRRAATTPPPVNVRESVLHVVAHHPQGITLRQLIDTIAAPEAVTVATVRALLDAEQLRLEESGLIKCGCR